MREAVRTNKSTGAIVPSSTSLAKRVTDIARLDSASAIVEFGPGTGVFTEVILRRKRRDASFMAMEVNAQFVHATRRRCPGVVVHHDCAQHTRRYLEAAGLEGCDLIVSGLPWSLFDEPLQDAILGAAYDSLLPGGQFVTFCYTSTPFLPSGRRFFRDKLPQIFDKVHRPGFVWRNFPPAAVYSAEKT